MKTALNLKRRGSVRLPANVQYAWPDPAGFGFLYVAASSNQAGARTITACRPSVSGTAAR
jgi:hypothetical protein